MVIDFQKEIDRISDSFGINKIDNANTWFKDLQGGSRKSKNVEKVSNFQSGKMYKFDYKCDEIIYDKTPLIICIAELDNCYTGINLNFLPENVAQKIVSTIRTSLYSSYNSAMQSNSNDAISQNVVIIPKVLLKALCDKFGADFAIRNYNKQKIKNQFCICYENWSSGIFLRQPNFEGGLTESQNNSKFAKYINKK